MGFQSDVFDSVRGGDGYRPLRRLNLITWNDTAERRELRSARDVRAAAVSGEIEIDVTGVVINMPIAERPGGRR